MLFDNVIKQIKEYADVNNVPIMADDGIYYMVNYIRKHHIKNILEIGTAIGYSAIMMASVAPDIVVTTLEKDEKRYLEAVKNIKKVGMEDRINLVYKDALDATINGEYDLVFIDAAKAQNTRFFEKYELNLKPGGTIITDNMNFHGLVQKDEREIENKNLRQLVRKVKEYREFLEDNTKYRTEFVDIGDGLAVSVKK